MELEEAVLEAIKSKLVDTFKKVKISSDIEGREVVIRISIPQEIMQTPFVDRTYKTADGIPIEMRGLSELDKEAQDAAKELLGELPPDIGKE